MKRMIAFACLLAVASAAIPFEDRLRMGGEIDLTAAVADDSDSKMSHFELPKDLKPQSYQVQVNPDLEKATFQGIVTISVRVQVSTNYIILNAKYIKLASVSEPVKVTRINVGRTEKIKISNSTFDVPNEQLIIEVAKALSPQADYSIEISYTGLLGKDMMGFYLSRYNNKDGKEKLLASTQFEPTGARRAFPCFDEPKYKTPYTIIITRNSVQKSISNMPLATSVEIKGTNKAIDTFEISPPMPTYLVGFAVFEFGVLKSNDDKFRVWGREDVIATQGQYIFQEGQKILSTLSEYMGIDYYSKMPKMDLVAVPDFDAGAMENWGMNTYREVYLLADASLTKFFRFDDITMVVTHEFSHQWFGDLLTPKSWDTVWLNEGFATFFEYFGTHLVEPNWRMEDLFVIEQVQTAFNADLKGSHAMTSKTTTPDSIAETFDHIIYNKGGSVLRMIEDTLTPVIFKESLQHYLQVGSSNTFKGTVEPAVLWDAFDDIIYSQNKTSLLPKGAESITDFTYEWVNSPGFPLVTFSRNYSTNVVTVTQQRFFVKKSDLGVDKTKWTIPVTYLTQENIQSAKSSDQIVQNRVWFPKAQDNVQIILTQNSSKWYYGNVKEVGFYRVNYDDKNWELLTAQLNKKPSDIQVLNRAQILDDAFTLATGDYIKVEQALALTQYLKQELDFIPWYAVWSHLKALINLYAETELGNQMKTYFAAQMEPIFKKLGLEDKPTEDNMSKIGRSSISTWLCSLGNSDCVNAAAASFRSWIQAAGTYNIPPNIKDAVYCTGIRLGSSDEWKKLWNYYLKTDLASEKVAVLYALGCSSDNKTLYEYLNKITSPNSAVRSQDHTIVIRAVIADKAGVRAALDFIPAKAELLLREAKEDEQSPAEDNLKSIISTLGSNLRTEEELKEFTKVLESLKSHANLQSTINRTLTHTAEKFSYRTAHKATLEAWFKQNTPSTTPAPPTSTPAAPSTSPTTGTPTTASPTKKPNSASMSQLSLGVLVASLLAYASRVVCL